MEDEENDQDKFPSRELWLRNLKCPVCLDYFINPHSLPCGHTFCLRCLRTIVKIARQGRERIPIERLKFRCPSCRKFNNALPILRRRAAINYAMKELLDECMCLLPPNTWQTETLSLRSVGVQTHGEADDTESADDTTDKESSEISKEEFREILLHSVSSIETQESKATSFQLTNPTLSPLSSSENEVSQDSNPHSQDDSGESSDLLSSEESDGDANLEVGRRIRPPNITLVSVLAALLRDSRLIYYNVRRSPSRMFIVIFWVAYSITVLLIANGFFPYMVLYTILFLMILYAEVYHRIAGNVLIEF